MSATGHQPGWKKILLRHEALLLAVLVVEWLFLQLVARRSTESTI